MEYKKYDLGSLNLHAVKTDKFKTVTIKIKFKRETKKEEITIRNLLSEVLLRSTKKYNTERLMNIERENLYSINYASSTTISGNYNIMSFDFAYLNSKYIDDDIEEDVFDFIHEIFFNPNIENKKFQSNNFNIAKEYIRTIIKSEKESPSSYAINRLFETMEDKNPISFKADGYIEDLEKINEENLYSYYEDVLRKDIVDIFIIGDIQFDKIKKIVEKKFCIRTFKKQSKSHYVLDNKIRTKPNIVNEKSKYKQSYLLLGYNLCNLTPFEINYVSYIYSSILGGSGDSKLFNEVREKNSLCYTIFDSFYRINGVMLIYAGIAKENYDKAVSLIKKEVKDMEKGLFSDDDIIKAKTSYISGLKEIEDTPSSILNMYVSKEYLGIELFEERINLINKVTKKDIISLAKKLKLNTVYFLEGADKYEKKDI